MHEAVGRRRRTLYVPAPGESVQQSADHAGPVRPSDPPIYRELMRHWAGKGKTLPGRRDPEWARLTAPIVRPGEFGSHDGFGMGETFGMGEAFGRSETFGSGEPFGSGEVFGTASGTGARPPRRFTPAPVPAPMPAPMPVSEAREPREPREPHAPQDSLAQVSETRDPRGDGR
ncbi:hypothetical protein ACIBI4_12525 [Streptomyces sp. NPDC050418]|uniref:hypothetical protein n=1 Tax=Streptomyces sp. NPDC050418 TaxID=3365612 RepID=UPI0037952D4A